MSHRAIGVTPRTLFVFQLGMLLLSRPLHLIFGLSIKRLQAILLRTIITGDQIIEMDRRCRFWVLSRPGNREGPSFRINHRFAQLLGLTIASACKLTLPSLLLYRVLSQGSN
ncbi:MAG: hypothetical protein BGP25_05465 [Lysobacterales bacterium 63-13]|nr:MAG: hypothetical protein BGP25_05465 [Xanthomonadales bacterium 63-13]